MKFIIRTFVILILFFLLFLFLENLFYFKGSKLVYLFFSLLSFYLIFSIFFGRKYFSEIFLSIYLWLGYWWKFSILQTINRSEINGNISLSSSEGFGNHFIKPEIINNVFISLIVAFVGLILSFQLFKFFHKDYLKINYKFENLFFYLYKKNRIVIIITYIILFFFISFTNAYFGLYQKGLIQTSNINPLIINIYKWLILIGLSFFGSVILFYESRNKKNIFWTSILVMFENFIVASSNLSRAMILNSSAIMYGLHKSLRSEVYKKNLLFLKLIIILFIFFVASFSASVILRKLYFFSDLKVMHSKLFDSHDPSVINKNIDFLNKIAPSESDKITKSDSKEDINLRSKSYKIIEEIFYLSSHRWVGIDSMFIVTLNKERNFNIFFVAFDDRFSLYKNGFYERYFVDNFNQQKIHESKPDAQITIYNKLGQKLYGVITPGFVSFFYYPNSTIFLFFSVFFIGILVLYFERFIAFFSGNNLILVSLLSHIVVYRLMHFGYLPHNTYLLLCGIMIGLLTFYFCKKIYFYIANK